MACNFRGAIRCCVVATLRRVAAVLIVSVTAATSAQSVDGGSPSSAPQPPSAATLSSESLPPWTEGYLYVHHISTGRGNSAYIVMPDGTTLLIDAGETDKEFIRSVAPLEAFPPRPNAEHDAGYWISDYIREFAPRNRPVVLDYALITHFHTDHMGTVLPSSPLST